MVLQREQNLSEDNIGIISIMRSVWVKTGKSRRNKEGLKELIDGR